MDVPAQMRAVRFTGAGDNGVVRVGHEPVPDPGPGEVLVHVAAAGLNRADIAQREGRYPPPRGASEIPGLEVSGTVAALGPEAGMPGEGRFAVGDRVCALLAGGGFAEYVAVPAGQLMAVPDGVGLVEAAALPEVACTVHSALVGRAGVQAGDRVLVHGATGGIGSFAVQFLAALGARVLGTAGGPEKVALGRRPEGRIVTLAVQGGAVPEDFNIMKLVVKRGWLTGATLRSRSVVDKAGIVAAAERAVWPLVAAGRIDASVGACFPLAEAAEAFDWFDSATRTGKVVLVTDPADARRPSGDRA